MELEEACHVLSALVSAGKVRMLRSVPTKTGEFSKEICTDRFSQKHRLPNKDADDPAAQVRRSSGLLTLHCLGTRQTSSEGNNEHHLGTYYRFIPCMGGTRDKKRGLGFSWLPKILPSCGTEWVCIMNTCSAREQSKVR